MTDTISPIRPPCCSTIVPRSRKMSLSSWIPLSISRISASRSAINVSWNSSSCGETLDSQLHSYRPAG